MRARRAALGRLAAAALGSAALSSVAAPPAWADGSNPSSNVVVPDPSDAAAGFGQPYQLSAKGSGLVDSPQTAVAPSGRTLVLWRALDGRSRRSRYMASIGDGAGTLAAPTSVGSLETIAQNGQADTVLAAGDGTFVVCGRTDPRHGKAVLGCTFAPPGQGFGRLHVIERVRWQARPQFLATARPDGQLILLLSHSIGHGRLALTSSSMSTSGKVGRVRRVATISSETSFDLHALADGTVAASWSGGLSDRSPHPPVLGLMAPTTTYFVTPAGPPLPAGLGDGLRLGGRQNLTISYTVPGKPGGDGSDVSERVIIGHSNSGAYDAPASEPRPGAGSLFASIVELADGSPFAVSLAQTESIGDCTRVESAAVGAGPLSSVAATPAEPLSPAGQLPGYLAAGTLADGAVLAVWGNTVSEGGNLRLEAAVRPAGATAFKASQVLPQDVTNGVSFASGGTQAILAWVVGRPLDGPSHIVVSALRRDAPYATAAALPVDAEGPCF